VFQECGLVHGFPTKGGFSFSDLKLVAATVELLLAFQCG
jgi:hypothetical protein